tara:strand:- start:1220 stop:1660 length:441 start_codon:yes stop_codon:yes gene_type:complete
MALKNKKDKKETAQSKPDENEPMEPMTREEKLKVYQEYMLDDDSRLDLSDPNRPRLKKAKGGYVPFKGIAGPAKLMNAEELKEFKEQLKKVKEEKENKSKKFDPLKKADGGMVLKQATDDRNRTPNKTVSRGGGAAIKGIKFSGVK